MNDCCRTGFLWDGTPTGRVDEHAGKAVYIAGDNSKRAVLMIHDIFGWDVNNARLLADHYAKEIGATVYLPDFFDGGSAKEGDLSFKPEGNSMKMEISPSFDFPGFWAKNSPEARFPEIVASARKLREQYEFVGAVGFCWGGSVGFKIGGKEYVGLLDCVTIAHPGTPTEEDVKGLSIPVQIISPEHDPTFTPESKELCNRVIPTLGIEYVYNYFPGVVHGFTTRSDMGTEQERKSLERAKDAVVWWCRTHAP